MRSFGLARLSLAATVCGLVTLPALMSAQGAAKTNQYGNPATLKPAPTKAAIDVRDLQIRLYQFADDSMLGRQVGRVGNKKGTDMIAAEVKRLGLLPGADRGDGGAAHLSDLDIEPDRSSTRASACGGRCAPWPVGASGAWMRTRTSTVLPWPAHRPARRGTRTTVDASERWAFIGALQIRVGEPCLQVTRSNSERARHCRCD